MLQALSELKEYEVNAVVEHWNEIHLFGIKLVQDIAGYLSKICHQLESQRNGFIVCLLPK